MRLIDADVLLEKLQRMIDYCKNDNQVNGLTALFQVGDAIMDCPTLTPQNEWVSVKERLPMKGGEYFVYTTDENISTAEFDEDCEEFGFWKEYYQDGEYLDSEFVKADWITHWMPFFAPPEKEN